MCANMSNDIIETSASDSTTSVYIQSFIKLAVTIAFDSTTTQGFPLRRVLQDIADDS